MSPQVSSILFCQIPGLLPKSPRDNSSVVFTLLSLMSEVRSSISHFIFFPLNCMFMSVAHFSVIEFLRFLICS